MDERKSRLKARTAKWNEVPERQVEPHILEAYRTAEAYVGVLTSLTFSHNELWNIYTHLIGALFLPPIVVGAMRVLSDPRFHNVSAPDYVILGLYFLSAEACLIFSATYHLMKDHSTRVEDFWHGLDLLGIVE